MQPPGRFGAIRTEGNLVTAFAEKPEGSTGLINGGFFVLEPNALKYIDDDNTAWEGEPINRLIKEQQLLSYTHHGFWRPMDTLRDKHVRGDGQTTSSMESLQ